MFIIFNRNYKKTNGAHQMESNCKVWFWVLIYPFHTVYINSRRRRWVCREEWFQEWNTRSSLLPGLPQNSQISTNILLILKENKLHKWDRCFLFVMTVAILLPPLPLLFFLKHQVVQWPWALKDIRYQVLVQNQ